MTEDKRQLSDKQIEGISGGGKGQSGKLSDSEKKKMKMKAQAKKRGK